MDQITEQYLDALDAAMRPLAEKHGAASAFYGIAAFLGYLVSAQPDPKRSGEALRQIVDQAMKDALAFREKHDMDGNPL